MSRCAHIAISRKADLFYNLKPWASTVRNKGILNGKIGSLKMDSSSGGIPPINSLENKKG